ncbi:MAG: threonine-phosphate decarboxylase CobD [Candidatus Omnitrophica bacterium]|nr:threonine-phosphate decarboxylase CobD [Candidatus Omnitrophota bacterium]
MDYLDFLHGGDIYEAEARCGRKIIDFSANINPLGLPPRVKQAILKSFDRILHYPDPNPKALIRKIAECWDISEGNVLLGNGSIELIYLVVSVLRPKSTLIPVPTFSEYERAARSVGSKIRFFTLRESEDFRLNLPRAIREDILFLCNPNNPTGNLITRDSKALRQIRRKLLLVDEAFMDFVPDEKKHTLIWKAARSKRIIVLRTFTKFFAIPGLRAGYLVAHRDMIDRLKRHQPPWSMNSLAQTAAKLFFGEKGYIADTRRLIEGERDFLFNELSGIEKLKPYPSAANFILIKIEDKNLTSSLLARKLIRKGIFIRDCANFRGLGNKFIRVAVRSRGESLKLIGALRRLL